MGLILLSISLAGCASSPSSYQSYPDPYRPVYSPSYPPVYVDPYPTTYTRSYPNYVYERRVIVRDQYRNNHHYQPPANHPRSNRPACPNPVVKDGRVVNCRHWWWRDHFCHPAALRLNLIHRGDDLEKAYFIYSCSKRVIGLRFKSRQHNRDICIARAI